MMKKILKVLPVAFVIFLFMGSACGASVVNEKVNGFSFNHSHDDGGHIHGFSIHNTYDSYYDAFPFAVGYQKYDDEHEGYEIYDDDTGIKFNDNEKSVWL